MNIGTRPDPPFKGTEKETLLGFLDFLRATIVWKLDGLDEKQARQPHQPSMLTLLGIVKHLTDVERSWFREQFMGEDLAHLWNDADPQQYWRIETDDTIANIVEGYQSEIAKANHILATHDLECIAKVIPPSGESVQLRWIVTHMIEETARHCGHADLIREAIDGQTGE